MFKLKKSQLDGYSDSVWRGQQYVIGRNEGGEVFLVYSCNPVWLSSIKEGAGFKVFDLNSFESMKKLIAVWESCCGWNSGAFLRPYSVGLFDLEVE
jgi:hypothetical protein